MYDAVQNTLSVETGRLKRWPVIRQTPTGQSASVGSVSFSPNGTCIVSGPQALRMGPLSPTGTENIIHVAPVFSNSSILSDDG